MHDFLKKRVAHVELFLKRVNPLKSRCTRRGGEKQLTRKGKVKHP